MILKVGAAGALGSNLSSNTWAEAEDERRPMRILVQISITGILDRI